MVAHVTPVGDVVVSEGDGSNPRTVGTGAVANAAGLTPLAWRSPGADSIAFVRNDGALVIARSDGSGDRVVANDASVPLYVDEQLLSWDISGTFLVYLAQTPFGFESKVVDFSDADDVTAPTVRTVGNPTRRTVLAQGFSPVDPIMWQRSVDPETNRAFSLALVEPVGGGIVGTPLNLGDPNVSPDGRFLVGTTSLVGAEVSQLVRLRITRPRSEPIFDSPTVCRPAISPDARRIVFGAGEDCNEVWVIGIDGSGPTRISDQLDDDLDFSQGRFSWSLDGSVISHPACRDDGDVVRCAGPYLNLAADGSAVRRGPDAGSVLWEQRPLIRPIKVDIDITGPVRYRGRLQVGAESVGDLVGSGRAQLLQATARDEEDPERYFSVELSNPSDSSVVAGSFRIVDGDTDERFTMTGRAALSSYGSAKIRGLWLQTGTFPFRTGQIVLTLQR